MAARETVIVELVFLPKTPQVFENAGHQQ